MLYWNHDLHLNGYQSLFPKYSILWFTEIFPSCVGGFGIFLTSAPRSPCRAICWWGRCRAAGVIRRLNSKFFATDAAFNCTGHRPQPARCSWLPGGDDLSKVNRRIAARTLHRTLTTNGGLCQPHVRLDATSQRLWQKYSKRSVLLLSIEPAHQNRARIFASRSATVCMHGN